MTLTPHLKHIILAVIIAVSVLMGVWKVAAHLEGVNHDKVVLDKAKIDADVEKAKLQANQTNVDTLQLQNQIQMLAVSNADLRASVASLRTQLDKQRKADDTLSNPDLAGRWATLIGTSPNEFQPVGDGIKASNTAAHATVDALEQVPELQKEAEKAANNSAEKDKTIDQQNVVIADTKAELATSKQTIVDDNNKCTAEKKELKAKQVKRNMVVAVIGFISGIIFKTKGF